MRRGEEAGKRRRKEVIKARELKKRTLRRKYQEKMEE